MAQDRVEPDQDGECFPVEHHTVWWPSQWVEGDEEERPPIRCSLALSDSLTVEVYEGETRPGALPSRAEDSSTVEVYEGETPYGASLAGHIEEGQHLQSLQNLLGEMAAHPDPHVRRLGVLAWVKWSYLERRFVACLDKPIDTLRADWQRTTQPPPFSS